MEQRTTAQNRVRGRCSLDSFRGCVSGRVMIAVCLFVCVSLLLVDDSTALPPDFFRVGRSGHLGSSSSHWKRSESSGGAFGGMRLTAVSDDDILSVVCSYCANYLSASIGAACQTNSSAESRRLCTESFVRDMRAFIQMDE